MITVSQLTGFDRSTWDEFAAWARARAKAARETSTDLYVEASRVELSWPDHNGARAARRLRAEAQSHGELATQLATTGTSITDACTEMAEESTKLRTVAALVAQHEHLVGPDEAGRVTESTGEVDLRSVLEHINCVAALQLTLRARTALVRATGLDNQTRLILLGGAGTGTQTAADGPLDLSDTGIALQAEVNAQDRFGSCVTLATLLGLASADPSFIRRHMKWDPDTRSYRVTLYRFGIPVTTSVPLSSVHANGSDVAGASGHPTWLSVYEQAIEQVFGDIEDGQLVRTGLARITGQQAPLWVEPSVQDIERALAQDPPGTVVAGTSGGHPQPHDVDPAKRLVPNHAYSVRGIDAAGNVVLQNPWGPSGGYAKDTKRYYPGVVRLTPAEYRRWFGTGVVANPPY